MARKCWIGSSKTKLTCDENGNFKLTVISDTAARRHKVQGAIKLQRNEVWGNIENWDTRV